MLYYVYLFKFFFGKCAFVTKLKSSFNLGKWKFSLNILCVIKKNYLYQKLFFLINDILPTLDRLFFNMGIFSSHLNVYYLVINDLNIFGEKKTNLGLFYLKKPLNIRFFCTGVDIMSTRILFNNLKVYLL